VIRIAANLVYLSLYAMQHRGQEAAGICSTDGEDFYLHKSLGLVADIFSDANLKNLKGNMAIGHNRYSTTGDNNANNTQPISAEINKGKVALAHNGNIVNAMQIKKELVESGSIFTSTTDSEIIIHLLARSKKTVLLKHLWNPFLY